MLSKDQRNRADIYEISKQLEIFYYNDETGFVISDFLDNSSVKANFHYIVLDSIVSLKLLDEEDSLKAINTKFYKSLNHGIHKLVKSNREAIDINYMICNCSNQTLLISFGVTDSMKDFLINKTPTAHYNDAIEGNFHTGLIQLANRIPISYFIDKICKNDYDIVLTGQSLGAAIAALVTIRILMSEEILKDHEKINSVMFIGFGPPAFSDLKFKEFIENRFKYNFNFLYDYDDESYELLDYLLNYLAVNTENSKLTYLATDLIHRILGNQTLVKGLINEMIKHFIKGTKANTYHHFGNTFTLNGTISAQTNLQNRKNLENFSNINLSLLKDSYFQKLTSIISKKNILNRTSPSIVDLFTDLNLNKMKQAIDTFDVNDTFQVRIIKNILDWDIILYLNNEKYEFITNVEFATKGSKETFKGFILPSQKKNEISFRFIISNKMIDLEDNKLLEFKIMSHFGNLILNTSEPVSIEEGFKSEKEKEIESLSLELLYLYAVFYVNLFQCDRLFQKQCEELKYILSEIDKLWELNGLKNDYNQKKLKMPDDFSADFETEISENLNFNEKFVSLNEYTQKETDFVQIMKNILPTCFELMKIQSKNDNFITAESVKEISFDFSKLVRIVSYVYNYLFISNYNESYEKTLKSFFNEANLLDQFSSTLPFVGIYEKILLKQSKLAFFKNKNVSKIYQMIDLNRKIRVVLLDSWMIGIVGEMKCGKSTFIENIIDAKKSVVAWDPETSKLKAYQLSNSVYLLDFPHFSRINNKLQFLIANKFLDHTILISDAFKQMYCDNTDVLYKICQKGKNFTVLLNHADRILDDVIKNKYMDYEHEIYIEKMLSTLRERLHNQNIHFTCFANTDKILKFENRVNHKSNILHGVHLKKKFYSIILEKIQDVPQNNQLRQEFIDKIKSFEKPLFKKIILRNIKGTKEFTMMITKDKNIIKNDEGYEIYDSFDNLIKELTSFFLQNNYITKIEIKAEHNVIISSIDAFLESDQHIFTVNTHIIKEKYSMNDINFINLNKGLTATTKRIIINQLEGGKRWIRLISLEDIKKPTYNLITSFEELENQFKSRKKLMPKFRLQSDKSVEINKLKDFFDYEENSFVVTYLLDYFNYQLKNSIEFKSEKLKLLIVQKGLNYKYLKLEIDSLTETVENIKTKISKTEGIDKAKLRLIFDGKELDNDKSTLLDNYIQKSAVLNLKIISEQELVWSNNLETDFCLKKKISNNGGLIHSFVIDLEIPAGAIDNETDFVTRKDFDYPINIQKLSPIFELKPHSIKFNKPITIAFKNCNFGLDDICLFKQEDDKIDRILKKWTIYYPEKCVRENIVEFKLDSFSSVFLGKLKYGIEPTKIEISNDEFNQNFKTYQIIHPGLNYEVICERNGCDGNSNLVIASKGYGTFRPIENAKNLTCHFCKQKKISIKSIIISQAEGKIEFSLNNTNKNDESEFEAKGNQVIIFGDEDSSEEYDYIIFEVLKSCKPHKNIIAGITKDDLRNSKNYVDRDIVTSISTYPNFNYKEFNPSNADFKIINVEIRIPFIENQLTPVFEYIQPHVTDNNNICMSFNLESTNIQNIQNLNNLLDSTKRKELCLCEQTNDEVDRVLNKWNLYFRANKQENLNSVEFELQRFYKAFLGTLNYEIRNSENEIIFPCGLTYFVSCESGCLGIRIINRGYGNFNPIADTNNRYPTLRCLSCNTFIKSVNRIQMIILHQACGTISFRLNEQIEELKAFRTNENHLIIFGDRFESFFELKIETRPLEFH